jgi:hypothetical protein
LLKFCYELDGCDVALSEVNLLKHYCITNSHISGLLNRWVILEIER